MEKNAAARAPIKSKLRALWADSRSYGKRLLLAGFAMLAACFTFLFFGPLEMVAFSPDSFSFRYNEILGLLALFSAAVLIAGSLLLALLRGKIFNYIISIVFAFTVSGYLQAAFMNGSMGLLTGNTIDWSKSTLSMLGNLLIWIGVIIAVFFIMYLHREAWRKMIAFVSLLLVVMQLAPTVGILTGAYSETESADISDYYNSTKGMYELSAEDNVLVFVLDYMDYDYIESILQKDAAYFDFLDGFTGYTNAISSFGRTRPSLVNLLTGYAETAYLADTHTFYHDAWAESGGYILESLDTCNYDICLYADCHYLFSDAEYPLQYVSNFSDGKGDIIPMAMLKKLTQLSAYRYAPTVMKPFFWADTSYFNADVFQTEDEVYSTYEGDYLAGFQTVTAINTENSFKLYHMPGSHPPYERNADGTVSQTPTTVEEQTMGNFAILQSIFTRMKALGIYEDATIIITADHGDVDKLKSADFSDLRIGMFYKPSGSAGTPLTWSNAPVSTQNIPATILNAVGADHTAFGYALDEITEDQVVNRVFYKLFLQSNGADTAIQKYLITGDAGDFSSWELIEEYDVAHGFYG